MPGLRTDHSTVPEGPIIAPTDKDDLVCYVNGKRRRLPYGKAEVTLLQWLREIGLTGTKLGCGEGGCGACTVMVSNLVGGKVAHRSVNACLCPLYSIEGMHVVTVEGIGNPRDGLHPVQERLAKAHGSQCGFCTPGFVMSMYSLLRSSTKAPSMEEIEENLAGNLCRCTGYRPILDAFRVFSKADPVAYTEEAIAASQLQQQGEQASTNGDSNGHSNGHANGHAKDDGANGAADGAGHDASPTSSEDLGPANGTNGAANGHSNGHANGHTNGKRSEGPVCPSTGRPCDCGAGSEGANKDPQASDFWVESTAVDKLGTGGSATWQKPSAEPIFPNELRKASPASLHIPGPKAAWYRPTSLQELLAIKAQHNDAKLVVGNTEVGIEMKFKVMAYPVLVGATHIPELNKLEVTEEGLSIGSSVTQSQVLDRCKELIASRPRHQTSMLRAMAEQLKYFAGVQIRNTGGVGGNIVTSSPISDMNPLYMAARAVFVVGGQGTPEREILAEDFFLGYRRVDLKPHEILLRVKVPWTREHEYVKEFKQAHRQDDDIAIVNAGMRMYLTPSESGSWTIAEARMAYGGVAAKAVMAPKAQAAMEGQPLTKATLEAALKAVSEDIVVTPSAPGGMVEFRNSLISSFLFRFFADTAVQVETLGGSSLEAGSFPASMRSAVVPHHSREPASGIQYFSKAVDGAVVGAPERHMAADLQVTGEAVYTDDTKLPRDALHAALVMSTKPHARLLSVDPSKALEMEGVEGYFDHRDVPGSNKIGPVLHDEEVFATRTVTCVGQIIGIVVADTEAHAREAARAVAIDYQELPALFSIDDAIEAGSYYEGQGNSLACGDVEEAFASAECERTVEGEARLGGQEHFYLEPNCCVVIPGEHQEITIIASSQGPMKNQVHVAHVLGVPANKVVAKSKRLGGGFGGKETRSVPYNTAAAVAAFRTRKAVRICLDRDEDMQTSGHRHAFVAKYKIGFTAEGRLVAVDIQLYNNAGNSLDLSASVMDRALMHSDNCYRAPNFRVKGFVCRTNTASNTAFRGFGGPQGMIVAEMWMDHVARDLNKPVEALRELNMYHEGDHTHFGQLLNNSQIETCWNLVKQQGSFQERRQAVDAFNAGSRYRKRGLALIPTKFGIAFTAFFLNQAGALVHVYTDGTCLVSHGGVEMGQGLHTKVAQIAAQELGIPLSDVFIAETATDKVANASPTAASASSDLYGSAVCSACREIVDRLKPIRAKLAAHATFKEVVNAAYFQRVDLSAHGFYITPHVDGFGGKRPFNYFTFGSALTEVELDTLTGNWHILRADMVMDVGQSLNPAIDIGQVEGGYVQGMGLTCLEELKWGDKAHPWIKPGTLFTRGPGTYKIPSVADIPLDLRVHLLRDAPCVETPLAHSSKAVGEPPLFLGASAFFALKDAVYAARAEEGHTQHLVLHSPCTPERLRMACCDSLTAAFAEPSFVVNGSF